MSNVLAGIGRGQLLVLEERIRQRRQVFEWYRRYLDGVEGINWMPEAPFGRSTRWLTACWLDPRVTAARPAHVIAALAELNIEARPVWKPMHRQPVFAGKPFFAAGEEIVSDTLFDYGMCLPSGSDLTEAQVRRICSCIESVMRRQGIARSAAAT
jgi:pyridoxal phosphate-dependent aminotransferase EpsN